MASACFEDGPLDAKKTAFPLFRSVETCLYPGQELAQIGHGNTLGLPNIDATKEGDECGHCDA
jgi:hypothetical protein